MLKEEFKNVIKEYFDIIKLEENQIEKFHKYMELLLEWNQKINLTAITEPKDVIIKHFLDSVTILNSINPNDNLIDIGTGAGFPGIPLKIMENSLKITLEDSLNKRLIFIKEVVNKLELKDVTIIHSRAEDLGTKEKFREKYNVVTSRAVASLNVLLEYMLPFAKIGGKCICMKGPNIKEEIEESKNAIKLLGGEIQEVKEIKLTNTDIYRKIIIVEKVKNTPKEYPRKAGVPQKNPLI